MQMIGRMSREAAESFFMGLPISGLSEQETELLNLLNKVASVVDALLPPGVSLQQWAEKRVPEASTATANASRMVYVPKHRKEPQSTFPARAASVGDQPSSSRSGPPPAADVKVDLDEFFDSMPSDLLPWEEKLNKCLHSGMRNRNKLVSQVAAHPVTISILKKELPPNVSFEEWIRRRAREFSLEYDENGDSIFKKRLITEEEKDDFFSDFPLDGFTPEEDRLRDAIIDFLDKWPKGPGRLPATIDLVCSDPAVNRAKHDFLPARISVKVWCERRMGQDVEFAAVGENNSRIAIGLAGQLTPQALEQLANRAQAQSNWKKRKANDWKANE